MEPRIFSNEPLAPDSEIVLTGNAQAHVSKVLRLREGAAVVLFDGSGLEFAARIESVTRRGVAIAVGTGRDPGTESRLAVTLVQGICRGQRMDLLIQKSTELGIASIRPVHCERSVVRLDAARASRKTGHWRQIAISACEQSGRVRIPEILPPAGLADTIGAIGAADGARLVLDPVAAISLGPALELSGGVTLLIGPEGGLTEAERETARAADFQPVSLGPRILRTETAPLAALSIIQYLAGDLGC